jgi:hypothetical protein
VSGLSEERVMETAIGLVVFYIVAGASVAGLARGATKNSDRHCIILGLIWPIPVFVTFVAFPLIVVGFVVAALLGLIPEEEKPKRS